MDVLVKRMKQPVPWGIIFAEDVLLFERKQVELEEKLEEWRKVQETGE